MIELEVKFSVDHLPDECEGMRLVKEKTQKDYYYDTHSYDLLQGGNFLRVRDNQKLDFKLDMGDDSHLYCMETSFRCEEVVEKMQDLKLIFDTLNVAFGDNVQYKDTEDLLKRNNLTMLARIEKKRRVYELENINITMDQVEGLGCFVEAEIILSDQDDITKGQAIELKDRLIKMLHDKKIIDSGSKEVKVGYVELYLMKYNLAAYELGKFKE